MSLDRGTWEFINTFAPWLAAFATTAAVVVSLMLARRASRTRLRVRSGMYHIVGEGQRVSDAPLFYQISVINTGWRPATIAGITWQFSGLRKHNYVMIPPTDPLSFKIPGRLDEGDEAKFFFTEAEFKAGLSETLEVLRRSPWPKLAVRWFNVGVYTNTGEVHLVPIDPTVRKVLLEQLELAKGPTSRPEPVAPPAAEIPARVTDFWPLQFRSSDERQVAVASLQASVASPSGLQRMTSARRPVIWISGETLFLSNGALDIARQLGLDTTQSTPISVADLPPERSLLIGDAIDWD